MPIYNLETHLPSFSHDLDSLRGVLEFDHLLLRSQNKPIAVKVTQPKLYANSILKLSGSLCLPGTQRSKLPTLLYLDHLTHLCP